MLCVSMIMRDDRKATHAEPGKRTGLKSILTRFGMDQDYIKILCVGILQMHQSSLSVLICRRRQTIAIGACRISGQVACSALSRQSPNSLPT